MGRNAKKRRAKRNAANKLEVIVGVTSSEDSSTSSQTQSTNEFNNAPPPTTTTNTEGIPQPSPLISRFLLIILLAWKFYGTAMNIYKGKQARLRAAQESCMISTLLDLDPDDRRAMFHPVMIFPNADYDLHGGDYEVVNFSQGIPDLISNAIATAAATATAETNTVKSKVKCRGMKRLLNLCNNEDDTNTPNYEDDFPYTVGKYNEKRKNVYTTDLFHNTTNVIDGYSGVRDVHIGVDLGGPVGSKVFAFADGVVHAAGYNAAHGDYGYVVVLEHDLFSLVEGESSSCDVNVEKEQQFKSFKLYALYGHLGSKKVKNARTGQRVEKGDVIGYLGDATENGGWPPHVHFQLSIHAPETHDMPGVVSSIDREKSLLHYPDPLLVLGELYTE